MRLLYEDIDALNVESIIEEATDGKQKSYWLRGPMIMSEERNKNGRIYSTPIVQREVEKLNEKIKLNKAAGELNHPQRPDIDPERIAVYLKEPLVQEGNIWVGKAKVASTPIGKVVKALMDDGYSMGFSTRGLGTVGKNGYVNEDFKMICVDLVDAPSIGRYSEAILESVRYKILEDGTITKDTQQAVEVLESKIEILPKHDVEKYLRECIQEFLRSIK